MSQPIGQGRIPLDRLQLRHPVSLGVYDEYAQAQKAVDFLSDREFPVQNVMIVGTDLKQVERVTGRLTSGRITASGAASGAWLGLFFGLLMWLFVPGMGAAMFLSAVLAGAVFGLVWAWLIYRMAGGARDFTSVTQVVATRYEVLVEHHLVADGRRLLEEMRRGAPAHLGRHTDPSGGRPESPSGWGPPQGPAQGGPPAAAPPAWGAPASGQSGEAPGAQAAPGGDGGDTPPEAAEPPRYRTYGEALDAERASREREAAEGSAVAAEDAQDSR